MVGVAVETGSKSVISWVEGDFGDVSTRVNDDAAGLRGGSTSENGLSSIHEFVGNRVPSSTVKMLVFSSTVVSACKGQSIAIPSAWYSLVV